MVNRLTMFEKYGESVKPKGKSLSQYVVTICGEIMW